MQLKNIQKAKNNENIHRHNKAKNLIYQTINTCKSKQNHVIFAMATLAFRRLILPVVEIFCSQNIENRVLGLPKDFLFLA